MTFLILSIVVFNAIAILIPKRLTKIEMFSTIFFSTALQQTVDVLLDLKYDLYGYFNKGVDLLGLIPVFGLYPAVNIPILNYYPFTKSNLSTALYILGWSAFLVAFEWASVKAGYFYHNGWKYRYSALAYPVTIFILSWSLIFIRRINQK